MEAVYLCVSECPWLRFRVGISNSPVVTARCLDCLLRAQDSGMGRWLPRVDISGGHHSSMSGVREFWGLLLRWLILGHCWS